MSDAGREGRLVNAEHEVQLHLVKEIRKAIREKRDFGELRARLKAWSEAHFASEELLMRRHAYPEAELHAVEHRKLEAELESPIDATNISRFADLVGWHIREHDTRLHKFLDQVTAGAR